MTHVHAGLSLAFLLAIGAASGAMAQTTSSVVPKAEAGTPSATTSLDIGAMTRKAQDNAAAGQSVEALEALDAAAIAVWEKMPLTVTRSVFVAEEPQGYGVFNPRDTSVFDASRPLLVYAELAGFGWRQSGDIYRAEMVLDFDLRNKAGETIASQRAFNRIGTASRHKTREFFTYVTYNFSGIEPGDYVIRTTVRDMVSQKQTATELPFTIKQ